MTTSLSTWTESRRRVTLSAEFLYGCVALTIDHDLPREIDFLRRQDQAQRRGRAIARTWDSWLFRLLEEGRAGVHASALKLP
jgi:hypothetical protein